LDKSKWRELDLYYLRLLELRMPVDLDRHFFLPSEPELGDHIVLGDVSDSMVRLFPEKMRQGNMVTFPIEGRTEYDTGYLQRIEIDDLGVFCDVIEVLMNYLEFEMCALP